MSNDNFLVCPCPFCGRAIPIFENTCKDLDCQRQFQESMHKLDEELYGDN